MVIGIAVGRGRLAGTTGWYGHAYFLPFWPSNRPLRWRLWNLLRSPVHDLKYRKRLNFSSTHPHVHHQEEIYGVNQERDSDRAIRSDFEISPNCQNCSYCIITDLRGNYKHKSSANCAAFNSAPEHHACSFFLYRVAAVADVSQRFWTAARSPASRCGRSYSGKPSSDIVRRRRRPLPRRWCC